MSACKHCGTEVARKYGRVSIYCSKTCQWAGQVIATAPKTCEGCGETFNRKLGTAQSDWANQRFCGTECSGSVKITAGFDGLSQAEVARRLGLSVRRVQQIEARAIRKMRNTARNTAAIRELLCLAT